MPAQHMHCIHALLGVSKFSSGRADRLELYHEVSYLDSERPERDVCVYA